ncbi:MAG: 6-bladed beta-propeller, partial [Bacteroides sp.]|nr:6-bladed beta-propeller [Bacteroides sp.]
LSSFFLLKGWQSTPPNLLSRFPDVETGTVENEQFEIDSVRNPYLMACVEGSIFFANLNQPLMLSQFDATSGKFKGDFLSRGEGPEELLFISGLSAYKDRLAVIDSDKKEILLYQMTEDGMT